MANKRNYKLITDEKREQIRALLATGKSCRAIAREVGVSDHTVRRIKAEVPPAELATAHMAKKKSLWRRPGLLSANTLSMCRTRRLLPKPTPVTAQ